jgi:tripeptide aminopeptidase
LKELKTIGLQDVTIDDKAYIMATLPSNVSHEVPVMGLFRILTPPDFTGANVNLKSSLNYEE